MSIENYILTETTGTAGPLEVVEEDQLSEQGEEMTTVRVVLPSGDEHHYHGAQGRRSTGYKVLESGVLVVGFVAEYPARTYSPSGWGFVEGDLRLEILEF
jgi:hypothetical protein